MYAFLGKVLERFRLRLRAVRRRRGRFHYPLLYVIAECLAALAVLAMIFNRTFGPIQYRPAIVSERHASKALFAEEEQTWIIAAR